VKVLIPKNVESFIASQSAPVMAKILRVLELLEEYENNLGLPHSKPIESGLFELKIKNIRIFYCFCHKNAQLLHGYIKKSQKTPKSELDTAKRKMGELCQYHR